MKAAFVNVTETTFRASSKVSGKIPIASKSFGSGSYRLKTEMINLRKQGLIEIHKAPKWAVWKIHIKFLTKIQNNMGDTRGLVVYNTIICRYY